MTMIQLTIKDYLALASERDRAQEQCRRLIAAGDALETMLERALNSGILDWFSRDYAAAERARAAWREAKGDG